MGVGYKEEAGDIWASLRLASQYVLLQLAAASQGLKLWSFTSPSTWKVV